MAEQRSCRKAQITVYHVALKVPVEKAGEQLQLEKCDSKRGPLSVFGEQCVSRD